MDDNVDNPLTYVRTIDTHIIYHRGLKEAIVLGLNHIS